jgi:retron-type reverse transcriptase
MRRVGYLFEAVCSFENLYKAFKKAFKGTGRTPEACRFHFHLEKELLQLKEALKAGTYRPAKYRYFKIFDPKERTISVAPFRDRVVHHAVVGILEPIFDRTFIYDSYATRKCKGTHRAIKRAQSFLKKNSWFLKADMAKYFDSIDHGILLGLVRRKVKDEKVLKLVERITRNSDASGGLEVGKGLPIGNLTSQFFANVYLDPLDHFLKDQMGVKYYVRYMDDMVVFSNSKDNVKGVTRDIERFLAERLQLKFNRKATFLNSRVHGLPFLGFRVFPKLIRVKRENLKRIKSRLQKRKDEFQKGLITEDRFVMSVRSMFEHVSFANSFRLRESVLVSRAGFVEWGIVQ